MRSFNDYLNESLEDKKFAEIYEEIKAETDLSIALTKRREDLDLTQQQLAEMTGIKQPMLARIEKGQMPKPVTLQKLAKALQIGIVFMGDDVKVVTAEYDVSRLFEESSKQEAKMPLGNVVILSDYKDKRKPKPLTVNNVNNTEGEKYEKIRFAIG